MQKQNEGPSEDAQMINRTMNDGNEEVLVDNAMVNTFDADGSELLL